MDGWVTGGWVGYGWVGYRWMGYRWMGYRWVGYRWVGYRWVGNRWVGYRWVGYRWVDGRIYTLVDGWILKRSLVVSLPYGASVSDASSGLRAGSDRCQKASYLT